jgi:hypothetical protein
VYVTAPYSDHLDESGRPDRYSAIPSRKVQIFGLGYRVPLYELGDSLDFTAGTSNVNSGTVANIFSITGAGSLLGARYNWNLRKFENYEHRLVLSLDWRSYDNKGIRTTGPGSTATQLIPDVTVHPWGVTYVGTYRQQEMESGWSLGFFKNIGGGNDGGSDDFCKANLRVSGEFCASSRYEVWKWSFYVNQTLLRHERPAHQGHAHSGRAVRYRRRRLGARLPRAGNLRRLGLPRHGRAVHAGLREQNLGRGLPHARAGVHGLGPRGEESPASFRELLAEHRELGLRPARLPRDQHGVPHRLRLRARPERPAIDQPAHHELVADSRQLLLHILTTCLRC